MFEGPPHIREIDEEYDDVLEYGMMCDDLTHVNFSMNETDEDGIYEALFTMEASFEHNVDKHRFREYVEDCRSVTDDNFDYISVVSDCEFEADFDLMIGSYKISIEHGEQ